MKFQELDAKKVPALADEVVAFWDPSMFLRTLLRLMLEETSADLVEATSRAHLLSIVRESRPAVVLIGTGPMPGLPMAFCRQLRALHREPPAIVLIKPRSLPLGRAPVAPWDVAMNKPFTPLQLFAALSRARTQARRRARAGRRPVLRPGKPRAR